MLQNPGVARDSLLAERLQTQDAPQALDHRRLARPATSHQHVEIRIEVNSGAVEKTALPRHRDQFGMLVRFGVTIQPNPRPRVQERLPQPFDPDRGHLDPAGRRRLGEIVRCHDVAGVYDGDGQIVFWRVLARVVGVAVLDDLPDVFGQVGYRARNLHCSEVPVLPGADPRLPLEHAEQTVVPSGMRGDRDAALTANAVQDLRKSLLTGSTRHRRGVDAELAEKPVQSSGGFIRRIEAEHVDPL